MIFSRFTKNRKSQGPVWVQFGPILIALAYALVQYLLQDSSLDIFYWQSPFLFTVLSGVAIAYACRPVLSRIRWTRIAAFWVAFGLMVGTGTFADLWIAWLMEVAGLVPLPISLPVSPLALLGGVWVAAWMMVYFYRLEEGDIDMRNLYVRYRKRPAWVRRYGVALLSLAAVGLWVGSGALDVWWKSLSEAYYIPLVYPNPWLRVHEIFTRSMEPSGAWGGWLYFGLLWLRGVMTVAPLVPVALTLEGSRFQLTLVFTMLLFVLGEFAPLMVDQPYPSGLWLVERTALGLVRTALLGLGMTYVFGVVVKKTG